MVGLRETWWVFLVLITEFVLARSDVKSDESIVTTEFTFFYLVNMNTLFGITSLRLLWELV